MPAGASIGQPLRSSGFCSYGKICSSICPIDLIRVSLEESAVFLSETGAFLQIKPKFLNAQWQPAQEAQLPEQPACGCSTVMGSPPFTAVLMMALTYSTNCSISALASL